MSLCRHVSWWAAWECAGQRVADGGKPAAWLTPIRNPACTFAFNLPLTLGRLHFVTNLGVAGGLLLLSAMGAGRFAVDALLPKKRE